MAGEDNFCSKQGGSKGSRLERRKTFGRSQTREEALSASLKVTVSLSYLILKENLHFISPCDIL